MTRRWAIIPSLVGVVAAGLLAAPSELRSDAVAGAPTPGQGQWVSASAPADRTALPPIRCQPSRPSWYRRPAVLGELPPALSPNLIGSCLPFVTSHSEHTPVSLEAQQRDLLSLRCLLTV